MNIDVFDPGLTEVMIQYFAVAIKYGVIYGIAKTLTTMLIKSFTGKEKFL